MWEPSENIIPISSIFPLLAFSKIKTNFLVQNLQEKILNALDGLIPWSSQCSLVIKDNEKVIFCFNASVGWKQSNVRVYGIVSLFFVLKLKWNNNIVCFTFTVMCSRKVNLWSCIETGISSRCESLRAWIFSDWCAFSYREAWLL